MQRISKNDTVDVACLGVGAGATNVLKGLPSSAFIIRINEKPFILIDCGLGVIKSFSGLFHLNNIPERIYITHNHSDHTGDLPVLLAIFKKIKKCKPIIYGSCDVLDIVKKYRMHELLINGKTNNDYATWQIPDSKQEINILDNVKLILFRSKHSYACYGFHFLINDVKVLSYTGDSAYNKNIYSDISKSNVIIVDGRDVGSEEHASLQTIDEFGKVNNNREIYILHYESTNFIPSSSNVHLWERGNIVKIF